MSLLWAVPVVAVALAAGLVLGRARTLERESLGLVVAARRTAELRRPLAELRGELRRGGPLADAVWSHWASPEEHAEDEEHAEGAEHDEDPADGPIRGAETPREQGTFGD